MVPGQISSLTSRVTTIEPIREVTVTGEPSVRDRAAASSGCIRAVQRSPPRIHHNRVTPCSWRTLRSRRPISNERLIPSDRLEPVTDTTHRCAQPIRIIVQPTHRRCPRADVPVRQSVFGIAFDPGDLVPSHGHQTSALCLAQRVLPGRGAGAPGRRTAHRAASRKASTSRTMSGPVGA
jgi:hypothetical protein